MGISINTNVAATRAGMYLTTNHANLQKSLDRLSSGKRITEPADDAGGLAVSMKLEHVSKGPDWCIAQYLQRYFFPASTGWDSEICRKDRYSHG